MKTVRRKMQHVAGRANTLFAFDKETHSTADDDRHLLVQVTVLRRLNIGSEPKPANHQVLTDDHLPFDSLAGMLNRNRGPVEMLRRQSGHRISFSHYCLSIR